MYIVRFSYNREINGYLAGEVLCKGIATIEEAKEQIVEFKEMDKKEGDNFEYEAVEEE